MHRLGFKKNSEVVTVCMEKVITTRNTSENHVHTAHVSSQDLVSVRGTTEQRFRAGAMVQPDPSSVTRKSWANPNKGGTSRNCCFDCGKA